MLQSEVKILETRGLTKRFNGFCAVKDVNLTVREGSVHALIGPNGAGKTTCFNLLSKFVKPSAGTIHFDQLDITHYKPHVVARRGLVRSFQISSVFSHLSVLDNVLLALQRNRGGNFDFWNRRQVLKPLECKAEELLQEVALQEFFNEKAGTLSYGRKRSLELATTLALSPRMLLLDEPTAGMTHEDVERFVELMTRIRKGRTVLMVEHNLSVVEGLCDQITVLARGQILAEGDYSEVSKNPRVIEAYLGTADA